MAAFGGNFSPFLSGFNNSLLVNTLLGGHGTPAAPHASLGGLPSAVNNSSANNNLSFTDPRSIFPLNLSFDGKNASHANNNNNDKPTADNETEDSNASSGAGIGIENKTEPEISVKSSSIADLRMKAKRHQEALGINDSD